MEKKIPSYCAQCRSKCGCVAVIKDEKLIKIEPLKSHPSGQKLCPKGKAAPDIIYHADRLTYPLKRTTPKNAKDPGWKIISWSQALEEISKKMLEIRDEQGAEQVAFSVTTPSGTNISDSISWIERFIRVFGSPNTIYGTEICNWHKDFATKFTFGTNIGTPDFKNTDCILLWGNNPEETWLARSVEIRKGLKKGAQLIVVDPRPTNFAKKANCWLRVRPGADQVLALGLANLLIKKKGYKHKFLADWTNGPFLVRSDTGVFLRENDLYLNGSENIVFGYDEVNKSLLRYDLLKGIWIDDITNISIFSEVDIKGEKQSVQCKTALNIYAALAAEYPIGRASKITGIPEEYFESAVNILISAGSVAYYAWNGVSQSSTATQTDRAIALLYTLTGSLGAEGGNIAGNGAIFNDISGHDLITEKQKAKALGLKERPLGPASNGWVTARDVYNAILSQKPYPIKMLFSFGGNILYSQPDTKLAKKALQKLKFHVHADMFLNPTANFANIVLPVASAWEREGLCTGFDCSLAGMRYVQLRQPTIPAVGDSKSDISIIMKLSKLLGFSDKFFNCDLDSGYDEILKKTELTASELRLKPAGIKLSRGMKYRTFEEKNDEGYPIGFLTPTRKIEIYSEVLKFNGFAPIPIFNHTEDCSVTKHLPLILSGAKTVAFCHSQHRNIDSLRKLMPDPILQISDRTAEPRKIKDGDWVKIITRTGIFVARAKLSKGLAPDSVFAQHGWWVGDFDSKQQKFTTNLNSVIDTAIADPISGSVPMRCSRCEIIKLY